jgi:hypothetical protein
MQRRRVFGIIAAVIGGASVFEANATGDQAEISKAHVAWVAQVIERIQTIKPGATRRTLLTVFTAEGGLSTGRTFVSRDCPYFKVDVEFRAVGRPDRDESGRETIVEGDQDVVLRLSKPYLQFSVLD